MLELLYTNLMYIGIAMVIFAVFWTSNFALSMYYNIKLLTETYDKDRLKNGILKMFVVAFGTALYAVGATLLIAFLQYIGVPIDDSYVEFLSILSIAGIFIKATYRYAKQAYETLNGILEFKN